jgi:hypothetical protein
VQAFGVLLIQLAELQDACAPVFGQLDVRQIFYDLSLGVSGPDHTLGADMG